MNSLSKTTDRRKSPRRDWIVGQDDVGRPVLEWKVDGRTARRDAKDPLARTYDFLNRLEVPDLILEEEAAGRNPYDTGMFSTKFFD